VVDIAAGVNNAVAGRLNSMVRKVGLVEDVALTGGCAKNEVLGKPWEEPDSLVEQMKIKIYTGRVPDDIIEKVHLLYT
jgi:activator of 2-hydroxyglutaryl-CoA dehydratase